MAPATDPGQWVHLLRRAQGEGTWRLVLTAKADRIREVLEIWQEGLGEGVKPGIPLFLSISSQNNVFKFLKLQKWLGCFGGGEEAKPNYVLSAAVQFQRPFTAINLPQKALKVFLSVKSLGGQGQVSSFLPLSPDNEDF